VIFGGHYTAAVAWRNVCVRPWIAKIFARVSEPGHERPRWRRLLKAYPRTVRGEGDRHNLLTGHRKMSQSPTVLG